ncbi:MAG: ribonuclease HI family protein [Acidobacteriota bacterium]|nr:ribonuclease HI family protein [Acidobacteriota bacterium]
MHSSLFPEAGEDRSAHDWYTAHCDGGSRGNPGPAGFGAVIEAPSGQVAARLSEFLGIQTNNYAEYQGLLAVLRWANQNGITHLRVVSDSELMVNQMKGRYKVASPILRPLWEEARKLASQISSFEMRHTLRGGNKEADKLANDAMDRGMGKKPAPTEARLPNTTKPQERLEGYVKNGVVHLLEGELPEGTFVIVHRKQKKLPS